MRLIKKSVFILLFIFLFFSFTKNYFEYRKSLSFYQSFKNDYENEKKRNTTLKTQLMKKNSLEEVEKTIRNKLNLLRPNELAVIIPPPTPTPEPIVTPAIPVYQQWWNVFFGK